MGRVYFWSWGGRLNPFTGAGLHHFSEESGVGTVEIMRIHASPCRTPRVPSPVRRLCRICTGSFFHERNTGVLMSTRFLPPFFFSPVLSPPFHRPFEQHAVIRILDCSKNLPQGFGKVSRRSSWAL